MEYQEIVEVLTSALGANEEELEASFMRGVVGRTQPDSVLQQFEAAEPEQLQEIPFPILRIAIRFSYVLAYIGKLAGLELPSDTPSSVVQKLDAVLSCLENNENNVVEYLHRIEEDFWEVVADALSAGMFSKSTQPVTS